MTRHAVYRFYNAADTLIYVGLAKRPAVRRSQHSSTAPWYSEIARQAIEWFPDRLTAGAEEQRVIIAEKPLYNKMQPPWSVTPERTEKDPVETARIMAELSRLSAELRRLSAIWDRNREQLHRDIRDELARGRTQAEIARITGYTREHIRQIGLKG